MHANSLSYTNKKLFIDNHGRKEEKKKHILYYASQVYNTIMYIHVHTCMYVCMAHQLTAIMNNYAFSFFLISHAFQIIYINCLHAYWCNTSACAM